MESIKETDLESGNDLPQGGAFMSLSISMPGRNPDMTRQHGSLLAGIEKRCLVWLAKRLPWWVQPDHLTLLALASTFMGGVSYAAVQWWPPALLVVNVWLVINWFGDSLDGTLARVRSRERPRYGFYVDHMSDSFGVLFLLGGLALSGYMQPGVALALLIIYLLLSINLYLAAYSLGIFQLSFWLFGPTELRILLGVGNLVAWLRPTVRVLGIEQSFFDVAGLAASAVMALVLVGSVARNTLALYRRERV